MVDMKMLVRIIALLVVLIVLIFVVNDFLKGAKEAGESSMCGLKMYVASFQEQSTLGLITPKTPPECSAKFVQITPDKIEDVIDAGYPELAIDRYYEDPSNYFEVLQFFKKDEASYWEWAVDKLIADQLFDCWSAKAVFGAINTKSFLSSGRTCLLCSKIQFKDKHKIEEKIGKPLRPFIGDENYFGSLGAFLRAEKKGWRKDDKTYDEWINNNYQYYPLKEIPFELDEEYAVVYVMTREEGLIPGVGLGQKSYMEFIPSDQLKNDYSKFGKVYKECDQILGT